MIKTIFPVTSSSPLEDRTFSTRDWYKRYQDNITPIGLAFYQTDWDASVKDFFHKTLNQKEPSKFVTLELFESGNHLVFQ